MDGQQEYQQESGSGVVRKIILAAVVIGGIVSLDVYTKSWATTTLAQGMTVQGAARLPLTLAFNQGVAFGLRLPTAGRWLIIVATFLVLIVLSNMFLKARPGDWMRLMALQLVGAGAIGNLIDRLRWTGGVVDFIGPFDLGAMQFPIFNIADMAITTGAVLLALSLLREDAELSESRATMTTDETPSLDMNETVS